MLEGGGLGQKAPILTGLDGVEGQGVGIDGDPFADVLDHAAVLFIEDEPALIDIGKEILSSLGYEVTPCTASEEALGLFKENPERFDLVITDLTMPKMTGDLLAQEIMRIRPEIPVILFTGYSDLVSRERFNKLGIRDCLMKPLTRKDLAESIRRVLDLPPEAPGDQTDAI